MKGLILALDLLGGLGVFLLGIKMMSDGLQKAAGDRLRTILYYHRRYYCSLKKR